VAAATFDPGRETVDYETGEIREMDDDEHVRDANTEVNGGVIISVSWQAMVRDDGGVLNPAALRLCVARQVRYLEGLVEVFA
jgi:hypothetical protein